MAGTKVKIGEWVRPEHLQIARIYCLFSGVAAEGLHANRGPQKCRCKPFDMRRFIWLGVPILYGAYIQGCFGTPCRTFDQSKR